MYDRWNQNLSMGKLSLVVVMVEWNFGPRQDLERGVRLPRLWLKPQYSKNLQVGLLVPVLGIL
jgi:hypothetical protein